MSISKRMEEVIKKNEFKQNTLMPLQLKDNHIKIVGKRGYCLKSLPDDINGIYEKQRQG